MNDNVLIHHGIKGQKWGIRRFQNEDGTRTALGKKHEKTLDSYDSESNGKSNAKQEYKQAKKAYNKSFNDYYNKSMQAYSLSKEKRDANMDRLKKAMNDADKLNKAEKQYKTERKEVRAESKQNAKEIRKSMTVGKKVAATVLGGPLGSVNYANYKAAGYSDRKALGKTYIDGMLTGGLSTGHSTRVRNKAAEREHFN